MTVSEGAQAALAGIVEASNDTVTLAAAIEAASFLDATPGEDRQKLRGGQVTDHFESFYDSLLGGGPNYYNLRSCQDKAQEAEGSRGRQKGRHGQQRRQVAAYERGAPHTGTCAWCLLASKTDMA